MINLSFMNAYTLFLTYFLLFISSSFAQKTYTYTIHSEKIPYMDTVVDIKKDQLGGMQLSGETCHSLMGMAKTLLAWKRSYQELSLIHQCKCSNGMGCSIDITNLLPSFLSSLPVESSTISGPNCWNAALRAKNINHHFRNSNQKEIKFWLTSPLCQKIAWSDRKLGDLVAVSSEGKEAHAFIYLDDYISFTKNGAFATEYVFQSTQGVFNLYGVTKNCQKENDGSCARTADWFRCKSQEDYLTSNRKNLTTNQLAIMEKIKLNESKIEEFVLSNTYSQDVELVKTTFLSLQKKINTEIRIKNNSKEDNFWWRSFLITIEANFQQISLINPIEN